MNCNEEILSFESADARLLGILALPANPATVVRSAMVIVVGGPQYRAGSHRQFTLLARRLAAEGIAVLRFDYTGMGDSSGPKREFTQAGADVKAAIDTLHARLPELRSVALWGLCDGASAALLYLDEHADPRVKGLCLVNPWVRSEQSFARTQIRHYYLSRLKQVEFWKKLFSGKVALKALSDTASHLRTSLSGTGGSKRETLPFQKRMARSWQRFPGSILLLLSGQDLVAREFQDHAKSDPDWQAALQHKGLLTHSLPDADHTCSNAISRGQVEHHTLAWLQGVAVK